MKKALLAVMAIALVIGFAGCDIFQAKSPYYPLTEGNKWEYSGTTTTTMIYSDTLMADYNDTTTVTSTTVTEVMAEKETTGDEPIKVWEVKSITTVDTFVTEGYSYVDADKDYIYVYKDLDATEEWYKIPSDPVVGDKWIVTVETTIIDSIVDTDTFTTTTTFKTDYEVDADGETANGYDNCIKIKATPENAGDYDTYESFDYWAKDVGSVMATLKSVMITPIVEETLTITIEGETKLDTFTEGS